MKCSVLLLLLGLLVILIVTRSGISSMISLIVSVIVGMIVVSWSSKTSGALDVFSELFVCIRFSRSVRCVFVGSLFYMLSMLIFLVCSVVFVCVVVTRLLLFLSVKVIRIFTVLVWNFI